MSAFSVKSSRKARAGPVLWSQILLEISSRKVDCILEYLYIFICILAELYFTINRSSTRPCLRTFRRSPSKTSSKHLRMAQVHNLILTLLTVQHSKTLSGSFEARTSILASPQRRPRPTTNLVINQSTKRHKLNIFTAGTRNPITVAIALREGAKPLT